MKSINEEIEKTLESWDNVKRFKPRSLYLQIEQKIRDLENNRLKNDELNIRS